MLISFDTRAYLLSKIQKYKKYSIVSNYFGDKKFSILGGTSGPQNFICDLINSIEKNNLAKTTFNFLNSDVHILNSGFSSKIWRDFQPKSRERIILRVDGIGIDSDNMNKKGKNNVLINLVDKSSYIIYQSNFAKSCFSNIYNDLPKGKVIKNGVGELFNISNKSKNILNEINQKFNKQFFTVAGRFTKRKRIYEITKEFDRYNLGNLVVLADVPKDLMFRNDRIIYLGIKNQNTARFIISRSLALIHFDQYDWCPNLVINAIYDEVPVVCSNYGGTPEIVGERGFIIKEFPKDLPANLEGIEFVKKSPFPTKLFREYFKNIKLEKVPSNKKIKSYDINKIATEYVKTAYKLYNY